MKKGILLLLSFLYLFCTSGVAVSTHFCGGKVTSVDVLPAQEKCGCGDVEPDGCCSDQLHYLKIKDSHKSPAAGRDLQVTGIALPPFFASAWRTEHFPASRFITHTSFHQFPESDICLRGCVFRI